jgi:hypothetical protein
MTPVRTARDENSFSTALWLLVAQADHHRCRGWTFEERDGVLRCACGVALYELRMIDQQGDPHPSPRPGPAGEEPADDTG